MSNAKMGSAQQFSLRWNNYSNHITGALDELRSEDELTDVTLCAEGNKVRAHKVLLSACSTFFRETFRENPCQHPVIILKGVTYADLQAVVAFMYNGQVNVTQERLPSFLQTAEMLQIKGLTDMNDRAGEREDGALPQGIVAKKRLGVVGNSTNASDTVQNARPPTPKRRRVVPSNQAQFQGSLKQEGSNSYNSASTAGPSTLTASALVARGGSVLEQEEYGEDVDPTALLNYEQEMKEEMVEGDEGLMGEAEYANNNMSEEGDNSLYDMSSMGEQGAIDSGLEGGGDKMVEEAEAMIPYSAYAYSDSADDMPTLSPAVIDTNLASTIHQLYKQPQKEEIMTRRKSRSHLQPRAYEPQPIPLATSTSHINILRRNKKPEVVEVTDVINPLELHSSTSSPSSSAASSSRATLKPQSPFVGEAMIDPTNGETMFPCLLCDKKYKLKSSLESHVKVHEGTENSCSICGQTMSRQRDLKRHVATVHRGLLMSDGTITFPPDIDEIVPSRTKKGGRKGGEEYFAPEILIDSVLTLQQ